MAKNLTVYLATQIQGRAIQLDHCNWDLRLQLNVNF